MNTSPFSSSFFSNNRRRLLKTTKASVILVSANGLLQKNADMAYPFRQDSNFWYLSGISEPDLILVICKDEEFIIAPDMYLKRNFIEPIDKQYVSKTSGIEQIVDEKYGWTKVRSKLTKSSTIATPFPSSPILKYHGIYTNPARRALVAKIKRQFPENKLEDIRPALAGLRMIKQPVETKLIQKALDITIDTLNKVLSEKNLAKYSNTAAIEKDILNGFISRGGQGHAFDPIVAAGINGSYVHYSKLNQPLKKNELIVCDVGCEYLGYSADITRTVAYGQATSRQQAVFQAVADIKAKAIAMIKPGLMPKDLEANVEALVGIALKDLGVISNADRKSIRKYYPHAVSHSLGLDTHDSADYTVAYKKDMIITVEPGIYLTDESIGVRIEDVVQITADGCKLMTERLPVKLKL